MEGPGLEAQETETRKRREAMVGEKAEAIMTGTQRNTIMREGETLKGSRIGKTNIREGGELQSSEVHLGTLNISGIAFGYRGKYMKTEEELLKIRPGEN
eukprot:934556-Pleurochrysis_carterae.AAC.2